MNFVSKNLYKSRFFSDENPFVTKNNNSFALHYFSDEITFHHQKYAIVMKYEFL